MVQKPKRKSNALAFLMPYIFLIGVVVVLIVLFGGTGKTVKETWNPSPDAIEEKLEMSTISSIMVMWSVWSKEKKEKEIYGG